MVSMDQIGYDNVSRVLESWDAARRTGKDLSFEKDFGKLLIDKFVELQPRSKKFYKTDEMMKAHSDGIVHLFDSILQMLGPDVEFIEEILGQIGGRHAKMGVSPSFFPFLGQAFIWAMEQTIGDEMTDDHKEAWEEVYDAISGEIIKAILNAS